MDVTFILSVIIFTLLAIVVATSVFNGSSSSNDFAKGYFGDGKEKGLDKSGPRQNGYVSNKKKPKGNEDWAEVSESSHDHWDVVKSVLSDESHSSLSNPELTASVDFSTSSLMSDRASSRNMSFDSDTSSGRRSFIGLSEKDLLKCAFSYPQTERATESPVCNESEANNSSFKYKPGMLRTAQMQMMMSSEELEEEQRVQREQLAAIFQLLKDNKDTFGEMSEVDMEEQLKLYSV